MKKMIQKPHQNLYEKLTTAHFSRLVVNLLSRYQTNNLFISFCKCKSFTKIVNNKGPKLLRWSTPVVTGNGSECGFLQKTKRFGKNEIYIVYVK